MDFSRYSCKIRYFESMDANRMQHFRSWLSRIDSDKNFDEKPFLTFFRTDRLHETLIGPGYHCEVLWGMFLESILQHSNAKKNFALVSFGVILQMFLTSFKAVFKRFLHDFLAKFFQALLVFFFFSRFHWEFF